MTESLLAVALVWRRFFDVFRRSLLYGVVTTFVAPFIYLASFSLGMSRVISEVEVGGVAVPYQRFVFLGIVGQTLLFQSFYEAAYGGFVRMYYQKVYKSIALTPIRLEEVLWAEVLWNTTRGAAAGMAILLLGGLLGGLMPMAVLLCVPVVLVSAVLYSSLGLVSAALARTIEALAYPQLLLVIPMTLFCGIYYPLESLGQPLAGVLSALPLSSTVELLRAAILGTPVTIFPMLNLLGWTGIFLPLAVHLLERRVRGG